MKGLMHVENQYSTCKTRSDCPQRGLEYPTDGCSHNVLSNLSRFVKVRLTFKWRPAQESAAVSLPCGSFVKACIPVLAVGSGQHDAWVKKRWSKLSSAL